MNFTEAVAEILAIVKRPDKISDIRRELNAAISFCCNEVEFSRDLMELSVPISSSMYVQSLPLDQFTRFRKFKYIKPPAVRFYLNYTPPDKIFEDCREARNTYYIAGSDMVIKTSALHSSLLVGWYAYPPVLTDASPNFWLLGASPYMLIDRAASKVFGNIGDDASAKKHMEQFIPVWLSARKDLISGAMP